MAWGKISPTIMDLENQGFGRWLVTPKMASFHLAGRRINYSLYCWWFKAKQFSPLPGEMIQFDKYFSRGLVQPPTSQVFFLCVFFVWFASRIMGRIMWQAFWNQPQRWCDSISRVLEYHSTPYLFGLFVWEVSQGTVDGSEIWQRPVDMDWYGPLCTGFHTCQLVS